ncbi:MAG: heme ABC exporter ATP-binding protein CcmA [Sphingomicrobium sp.]
MRGLLAFEAVTLHRGGRVLFEDLSLAVAPGDGLHLAGPNGAGKSSLLRLAAGLLRPERGTIHRARLALADEGLALDAEVPLRRALAFWSRLGGAEARLDEALDALDLSPLADVPVRLLSTGQAKRASLARVAASGAPLWLLDEPLNGLDASSVEGVERLVAGHRSAGGGVLVASHLPLIGDWVRLELGQ